MGRAEQTTACWLWCAAERLAPDNTVLQCCCMMHALGRSHDSTQCALPPSCFTGPTLPPLVTHTPPPVRPPRYFCPELPRNPAGSCLCGSCWAYRTPCCCEGQSAGTSAPCTARAAHLLGQVAGALWRVEDLIIEHREVERQAQPDGVCGRQVNQGDVLQAQGASVGTTSMSTQYKRWCIPPTWLALCKPALSARITPINKG
jgi:hypothetical protein